MIGPNDELSLYIFTMDAQPMDFGVIITFGNLGVFTLHGSETITPSTNKNEKKRANFTLIH